MSTPAALDRLRKAATFTDLLAAAHGQGLDAVLDQAITTWLGTANLTGKAVAGARAVVQHKKAATLRELLTRRHAQDFLRIEASRAVHDTILLAIRDSLVAVAQKRAKQAQAQVAAVRQTPPAATGLAPGMSRKALVDWATKKHVRRCLDLAPADVLDIETKDHDLRWSLKNYFDSISAVVTFDQSKRSWQKVPVSVQQRAIDWLQTEAQAVARGVELEKQREPLRKQPEEPRLQELWRALRARRLVLRKTVAPRDPGASTPRFGFSPEPPTFHFSDSATSLCQPARKSRCEVHLVLAAGQIAAECGCKQDAPCELELRAVDALLDILASAEVPAHAPFLAAVSDELGRPAWSRTLADFDVLAGHGVQDADKGDIGWRFVEPGWLDGCRLEPVLCVPYKRGEGVKLKRFDLQTLRSDPPASALPADLAAAEVLMPSPLGTAPRDLPAGRVLRALACLVGHPRVFFVDAEPLPVRRDVPVLAVEPYDGDRVLTQVRWAGHGYTPRDFLDRVERSSRDGVLCLVTEGPRGVWLGPVDATLVRATAALARRGNVFPAEAAQPLLEKLTALGARMPVQVPAALRGELVPGDARPVLRLDPLDGGGLQVRALVRPLAGGATSVPGEGRAEVLGLDGGRRIWTQRDLASEAAAARDLLGRLALRQADEQAPFAWQVFDPEQALDLLTALPELGDACRVEWPEGALRRRTRTATGADLRVAVKDKRDWFGLEGGVTVEGHEVPIAQVVEALRQGRRYVAVGDSLFLKLADELRRLLEPVADAAFQGRAGLEVSPLHAGLLAGLDGAGKLEATPRWHDLVGRIRQAPQLDAEVPPGLRAELRDYQRDGYRWLVRMASWSTGACLADDMGLGKTVQALAFLLQRSTLGPALVVAPVSVGFNWLREAARFAPGLRVCDYRAERKKVLGDVGPGDLVVVGYDLLARDAEAFAAVRWSTLVLDEAQAVKNATTRRAQAAAALQADFHLALTGTPVENRLGELWSLFRIVAPGLLGSWEQFRDRFAGPIERQGDAGRRQALSRLVRAFVLRRVKTEVASELPAKTEIRLDVVLSRAERELYDAHRLAAVSQLQQGAGHVPPEQRRFQVLAAITRLRQLACHPQLVDAESQVPSSKLQALAERLAELRAEGHRALVFSQFTRHLALVRGVLDAAGVRYRYLDGQTPEAQRRAEVDAFQQGDGDVFLLSLKAGGTGLNLTAADYVIHLDPWWNPAVEDQATDRAHRIGQDKPVTVYRLVALGTIEEAILQLHADKRELISGLLDGTGGAAALTTEDLVELLAAGGNGVVGEDEAVEVATPVQAQPAAAPAQAKPVAGRRGPGRPPKTAPAEAPAAAPVTQPGAVSDDDGPPTAAFPQAGLTELVAAFGSQLKQQADGGEIRTTTVGAYLRPLQRWQDFVASRQLPVATPDEAAAAQERYLAEVGAGTWQGPASDFVVGATAFRRFTQWWAGSGGAAEG